MFSSMKKNPNRFEYYNTIVHKCGGSREKDAMKLLFDLVGE
jgi:hypothetical protein